MQSRQETSEPQLSDELPQELDIKEVVLDDKKETTNEPVEGTVEVKPTDVPERKEVVQESVDVEVQCKERTQVERAKEIREESQIQVETVPEMTISTAVTEVTSSSLPVLVDLQEQFKNIYHIIRESLDADGERRSKKLFRLPTKQSKSGKQYYELIKNPIDLQTINKKINNSEITTVQELQDAFNSLFANALLFNQHQSQLDSTLVENVTFLQNAFAQEVSKVSQPTLSPIPQQTSQTQILAVEEIEPVEKTEEKKEHTPKTKKGRGKKQKEVQESEPAALEIEKPVQEKEPVKAEPEEMTVKSTRKSKRGKAVDEALEQTESVTTSEKPKAKKAPSLTDEEIKGMKVTELKAELKKRGISQSGLKAELIQRLITAVSSEN